MVALLLSLALAPYTCTVTVGVNHDGSVFMTREGAWLKSSKEQMKSLVKNGCWCAEVCPKPTDVVRLAIAPGAPDGKIDEVLESMKAVGWPKEKVQILDWKHPERPPR